MKIVEILDQIYKLPETSHRTLQEKILEVSYPKGTILLNAKQIKSRITLSGMGDSFTRPLFLALGSLFASAGANLMPGYSFHRLADFPLF